MGRQRSVILRPKAEESPREGNRIWFREILPFGQDDIRVAFAKGYRLFRSRYSPSSTSTASTPAIRPMPTPKRVRITDTSRGATA